MISIPFNTLLGYIEYPSDVAFPIKLDIRNRDGYPINSGTRSSGRVPDYFGRWKKPDPTRTSGSRTPLLPPHKLTFFYIAPEKYIADSILKKKKKKKFICFIFAINSFTINSLLRACKFFPYWSEIFYHQISYAPLTDPNTASSPKSAGDGEIPEKDPRINNPGKKVLWKKGVRTRVSHSLVYVQGRRSPYGVYGVLPYVRLECVWNSIHGISPNGVCIECIE